MICVMWTSLLLTMMSMDSVTGIPITSTTSDFSDQHEGQFGPFALPDRRMKRSGISDQRLVELETILALQKLQEELMKNQEVAYGLIDPHRLGRRRRSIDVDRNKLVTSKKDSLDRRTRRK